jgi:hypothetical protein
VPIGRLGETIARGFDKLGWHWWISDGAILSRHTTADPAATCAGRATLAARRLHARAPT